MLRFFRWLVQLKIVFLVLTIMAAVNTCLYFFVHRGYLEAPSGDLSPAKATASGEPTGGERHDALKSFEVLPEGAPSKAGTKAEGSGEDPGNGTGGDEKGDEKPASVNASQSTSVTAMPSDSTALYTATSGPGTAGVAQYATAGATAEGSPRSKAAKKPLKRILPPGIRQPRRIP
jgi:hypothetical protein